MGSAQFKSQNHRTKQFSLKLSFLQIEESFKKGLLHKFIGQFHKFKDLKSLIYHNKSKLNNHQDQLSNLNLKKKR